MKRLSCQLFALIITTALSAVTLAQNNRDGATLKQISEYSQWTKVNQEPVIVAMPAKIDPSLTAD
jgi:hypothetical protein